MKKNRVLKSVGIILISAILSSAFVACASKNGPAEESKKTEESLEKEIVKSDENQNQKEEKDEFKEKDEIEVKKESEIKEEIAETEKIETEIQKEIEPVDPPDIMFVKRLREELQKGNMEGAINLFQELPEELKDDLDLKFLLASIYFSSERYDEAKKTAEEILAVNPAHADALELLSIIAKARGNQKEYGEISKKILENDPNNAAVNIQIAQEHVLNHKYKHARSAYAKALKSDPDNEDALFGYGQTCFYLGDIKEAKRIFNKMILLNDKNAAAYAYLGKLEAENYNFSDAKTYIEKALEFDAENYDYLMDLGSYQHYLGLYADAEATWTRATEIEPDYFLAYTYLAGIFDEQNKFEEALENYHKVIQTNPKYFYAYESTAILEYHFGNMENARKYFLKAYEYSKNYSYPLMIAATYYWQKDSLNAKKILEAAMKNVERNSLEYEMLRFYHDAYSRTAETSLANKIAKETNTSKRGKMMFYMGLYYEINGGTEMANEYYGKVTAIQSPMFFEFRLAEWSLVK